jgi:single-strand DNA-binding protein
MDLNRVLLIGNLTRDPETRHTTQGSQVTKFDIAVNDRSRGKENETTMFIRIETWNKTAEIAAQYLAKGSTVLVEGRLKIDEYTTKEGQKRRDPLVVADRISLGPKPRDGQGGGGARSEAPSRSREAAASRDEEPARRDDYPSSGSTEDDLPF